MALMFLALQVRMLMELPEKGTGVQAQVLAQLGGGQSAGRLADQGRDRLRQMAMAGKADVAMKPKPELTLTGFPSDIYWATALERSPKPLSASLLRDHQIPNRISGS